MEHRLGRLQQVILSLLWEEEMYGLEIQRDVCVYGYKVTSGQLYPALKRLEDNQCITSFEATRVGANRKYYSITEKGKVYLMENVLDQIKIIEILAAKKLSKALLESECLTIEEGDTVVGFSDMWFKDVTHHISNSVGSNGSYIIATGDERESSLLSEWINHEGLEDRIKALKTEPNSVQIRPQSVDLVLVLFRMHLEGSSWILSEANKILRDDGRVLIYDLLDIEQDFRSVLYGEILPRHSRMGVKMDEIYGVIERNQFEIIDEATRRGLLLMTLGKKR